MGQHRLARRTPPHFADLAVRAKIGVFVGVGTAAAGIAVGLIRAIAVLLLGHGVVFGDGTRCIAWYVTGFAIAGLTVGLFWPVSRSLFGRYLLGIVGATIVFAAIAKADAAPSMPWRALDWSAVGVLGSLFGLLAGYLFGKKQ